MKLYFVVARYISQKKSFGNLLQARFFLPSKKNIFDVNNKKNNRTQFWSHQFFNRVCLLGVGKTHTEKWIIEKAGKIIEWKIQSTIRNHCRGKLKNNFASQTSNVNIEKFASSLISTHFRTFFWRSKMGKTYSRGLRGEEVKGKLIDTRQARKKLIEWMNRSIVIKQKAVMSINIDICVRFFFALSWLFIK